MAALLKFIKMHVKFDLPELKENASTDQVAMFRRPEMKRLALVIFSVCTYVAV